MSNFNLLWESIVRSSLWVQESKETRLVWVTILALKNKDGVVMGSVVGLADSAKVTVDECRDALLVLTGPDPNDTSKVDDGRRLREIPGGWQVVNHERYRYGTEAKRAYWAQAKRKQRAIASSGAALPGESAAVRAMERGDEQGADAIAAEGLPG